MSNKIIYFDLQALILPHNGKHGYAKLFKMGWDMNDKAKNVQVGNIVGYPRGQAAMKNINANGVRRFAVCMYQKGKSVL